MKSIIINLVLLIIMLLMGLFVASSIITLLSINIPFDGWSIAIILFGIICLFLIGFYPIRLCILDIIRDYKYYRKNRPVKILNYIKLRLDKISLV